MKYDFDENSDGTYVALKVKNYAELAEFFRKQGIDVIEPINSLHVTVAYSVIGFKHTVNDGIVTIKPGEINANLELLGENCWVMKFNNSEIQSRFNKCMEEGASFDYPTYQPHITITNSIGDLTVEQIKMPDFDIILGDECTTPIKNDFSYTDTVDKYTGENQSKFD